MLGTKQAIMDSGWRNYVRRVHGDAIFWSPGLEHGGTTLFDYSDNVLNGTITGATLVRLPSGVLVYYFNGSDNKIVVGDNAILDSSYRTVMAWVKPEYYVSGTGIKSLVSKEGGWRGGLQIANEAADTSCRLRVGFVTSAGNADVASAVNLEDAWHFAVGTYDGANLRLYIDGSEDATSPTAIVGTINANADDLYIGGGLVSRYMKGYVGLLGEMSSAISAAQVADYYAAERWMFGV